MTPDRWKAIQEMIHRQYTVDDDYTEDLDPGTAHCLEFSLGSADLKVCFIQRPKVLDKKTHYSHRGSGNVNVDYTFSEDEVSSQLEVSRWDDVTETWQPFAGDQLFSQS